MASYWGRQIRLRVLLDELALFCFDFLFCHEVGPKLTNCMSLLCYCYHLQIRAGSTGLLGITLIFSFVIMYHVFQTQLQ